MIRTVCSILPFPSGVVLRQLLNPTLTDGALRLLGKQVEQFEPLLHNTLNPTIVRGVGNPGRIPDSVSLGILCNLLPGYSLDDAVACVQFDQDAEVKVTSTRWCEPVLSEPNMGLFSTLADILREAEPECVPCPLLSPGPTDGRLFARLGIQTYGFLPMNLPPDFAFRQVMHAADERIPVEALTFGTDAIYELIQRFGD